MVDISLLVNFALLLFLLWLHRRRLHRWVHHLQSLRKVHYPRFFKPQSPRECAHCQAKVELHPLRSKRDIVPYARLKSRRGRKKTVPTQGFACPYATCGYFGVIDESLHALVGYGQDNGIQRLKCQACGKVFTSRINTPLYYLKTAPKEVEMVLWFLAEGVDVCKTSEAVRHERV